MGLLRSLKPSSSPRTRLLLASLIWTAVGIGLLATGTHWLLGAGTPWVIAGGSVAVLLGVLKGRLLLNPRAGSNAERIVAAGESRCLGGVFSWAMWLLVLVMMSVGMLLRLSPLPRPWLGAIYVTVGIALLVGAFVSWSHWSRTERKKTGSPGMPS